MPNPQPPLKRRRRVPVQGDSKFTSISASRTITVPPEPTAEAKYLYVEQQVTRVEQLMIKGVRMPREICSTLGIPMNEMPKVIRWMKMARSRWDVYADEVDVRSALACELASLANLEQECWVMYQGLGKEQSRDKAAILAQLLKIYRQRADLTGLSKENIAAATGSERLPIPMLRSMEKQTALIHALTKVGEFYAMKQGKMALDGSTILEGDFIEQVTSEVDDALSSDDQDDYEEDPD